MNTSQSWRDDPALRGRFHPDFPDALQVIVHEGGPRLSQATPELMWVRVLGCEGSVYRGQLLNAPHNLSSLQEGSGILFVAPAGAKHPLLVSPKYLSERSSWKISPCDKCGLPELFDAPSDLIARIFPDIPPGSAMEGFTSFCPLCGGVQVVEAASDATGAKQPEQPGRSWWRFW